MRILGIDYGEKRIGVSISDPLGLTAQGIAIVKNIEELKNIADKYQGISKIVIGLPKTMRGEIGPSAQKVLIFIDELKKVFNLPIITWDERLTSAQANRMYMEAGVSEKKRRATIDMTAAVIILQNYLDSASRKKINDHT